MKFGALSHVAWKSRPTGIAVWLSHQPQPIPHFWREDARKWHPRVGWKHDVGEWKYFLLFGRPSLAKEVADQLEQLFWRAFRWP